MIKEKITTRQMIIYILVTRLSVSVSVMAAINLPPYNHDNWIMVLYSIIHTTIVMIPLLFLANKFKEYSMVGYMKITFGKTIGKFIGILYGLYFIMLSINGITIQSELVATNFLVNSSNIVIILLMVTTCIYLTSTGIKNILISSELIAPISIFLITILLLVGLPKLDYSNILPILKYSSFKDMNVGAVKLTPYFTDIFLLTMIVPDLENKKDINKIFFSTMVLSLVVLSLVIVVVFGSLGVEQARHSNFPYLLYVRSLKDIKVLARIDPIFVVAWLVATFLRIIGFLYIAIKAIREVFNKDEREKIILFLVSGISGLVSMLILNFRSVIGIRKEFNLFYAILFAIFGVTIPIITCIVYFFRRKSIDKKLENQRNSQNADNQ